MIQFVQFCFPEHCVISALDVVTQVLCHLISMEHVTLFSTKWSNAASLALCSGLPQGMWCETQLCRSVSVLLSSWVFQTCFLHQAQVVLREMEWCEVQLAVSPPKGEHTYLKKYISPILRNKPYFHVFLTHFF